MFFGLTNALASFQHIMNDLFRNFLDDFMIIYLDDILIFSKNQKEHEKMQILLSTKFGERRLCVKMKKCIFHLSKVNFLGYIIFGNGLSMDPKTI